MLEASKDSSRDCARFWPKSLMGIATNRETTLFSGRIQLKKWLQSGSHKYESFIPLLHLNHQLLAETWCWGRYPNITQISTFFSSKHTFFFSTYFITFSLLPITSWLYVTTSFLRHQSWCYFSHSSKHIHRKKLIFLILYSSNRFSYD